MLYLISWLVTLELIGVVAFLYVSKYFPNLGDRGFSFCKPLALIVIGFTSWLLCIWNLTTPGQVTLCCIVGVLIVGLVFHKSHILLLKSLNPMLWKNILISEIVFLSIFSIFALIKFLDPSINHTEQPMDFAFLNASMSSPSGGPIDPWMSGEGISYYYFGYWVFGTLATLSSVPSSYAYNLAIASIPALSASAVFGILLTIFGRKAINHIRPLGIALLGSIFALNFVGNIYAIIAFLRENSVGGKEFWSFLCLKGLTPLENVTTLSWYPTDFWWWFNGTRIINYFGENCEGTGIDYTITEFPFFSYILGDLHPHVMVIPFFISSILVIVAFSSLIGRKGPLQKLITPSFIIGVLIAGCSFINMWSLPVCLAIYLGITGLAVFGYPKHPQWKIAGAHIFIVLITASLLLLPYFINFQSAFTGLHRSETQTRLIHGLIIWGPLFVINLPFVIQIFFKTPISIRWMKLFFISILICAIPWVIRFFIPGSGLSNGPNMSQWALPMSGISLTALIPAITLYKNKGFTGEVLSLLCIVLSLTLILVPELFYVGDPYSNRMNTVFKFYQHAWILLSISSGYILFNWTSQGLPSITTKKYVNWPIYAVVSLVILSGSYYSAAMFTVKASDSNHRSFNGLIHLPSEVISAIKFAEQNISLEEGILESVGEWDESGIISRSTGIPNIINWPGHQRQWRGYSAEIDERIQAVNTIYSSENISVRKQQLEKYKISYVYVGHNERRQYTPEQLSKFELFGNIVFENKMGIQIFKIE